MTISFKQGLRGAALGLLGGLAWMASASAAELTGAGSTAIYPVLAKWASAYEQATGIKLNYQSIGSGGGIQQVEARTVDFGATDAPLSVADLDKNSLIQWPGIVIGVVPVVNIPGIGAGQLKIDGPTLAGIFMGTITRWDDPAITKLNPGLKLPSTAIAVVHRSDGSGTTFTFTGYLGAVSPDWKSKVGVATAVDWPVGVGGKGNEGVAGFATQTAGSIGYVEYAYALQNKLAYVDMTDSTGASVAPSVDSFSAAAANADWAHAPGFALSLDNQPGAGSWPITGVTYILLPKTPKNPEEAAAALKFFDWTFASGAKMATDLAYVPIPTSVVQLIESNWSKDTKGADGRSLWASK